MKENIELSKEIQLKLINDFWRLIQICNELNVYEREGMCDEVAEMREWYNDNIEKRGLWDRI